MKNMLQVTALVIITVGLFNIPCQKSSSNHLAKKTEKLKSLANNSSGIEEAKKVVEDFWRYSLDGNKVKSSQQIREVPEQFIEIYSNKILNNQNIVFDTSSAEGSFPKGDATGASLTELKNEYFLLTEFSKLINERKYKLFNVREVKSNENEAILMIGWGQEKDTSSAIQEWLFLYKENGNWKIFMSGNSYKLAHYKNENFAQ